MTRNKLETKSESYFINVNGRFVEIYAEPIELEGFEEYDLFVHPIFIEFESGSGTQHPRLWKVSEGITGLAINKEAEDDPDDATVMVMAILSDIRNIQVLKNTIATAKKSEVLLSPRYKNADPEAHGKKLHGIEETLTPL